MIGNLLHFSIITNRHKDDGVSDDIYSYTSIDDEVIDFAELYNKYTTGSKVKKRPCNSIFIHCPNDDVCIMPLRFNESARTLQPIDGFVIPIPTGMTPTEYGITMDGFQFVNVAAGTQYRFIANYY